MKKTMALALAVCTASAMLAVNASAERGLVYTAPNATPTVDGVVEEVWDAAEWTQVDLLFKAEKPDRLGHAMQVKLLWDSEYIYFLADMTCTDTEHDKCIAELYLDEGNNKAEELDEDDAQFGFGVDGIIENYAFFGTGNARVGDCLSAATLTDTGYIVEAAVPYVSITPEVGTQLGLEFMANIQPGGVFANAFRWNVDTANGDPQPAKCATAWGTLVLGEAPAVETEAPVVEEVPAETEAPAETVAPTETVAPQTGDTMVAAAVAASVLLAGAVVASKKKMN